MRAIGGFFKTTVLGGLLVLLPVLLVCIVVREVFQAVIALALPLRELLPNLGPGAKYPVITASLTLVLASFLIGLLARSRVAKRVGRWFESKTFDYIPVYRVLRELSAGVIGSPDAHAFRPALFAEGTGDIQPAYIVEDFGGDRVTIMLPWAPSPLAGSIRIVSRERVQPVNVSLGDFTMILSHWGIGAQSVISRTQETEQQ